ncbi:MAG: hypothetical protein ACXW0H_05660, partial [Methylobacter sp.]
DCYVARKLHEVCINHKLANHLERHLLTDFKLKYATPLFFDLEFNKEGKNEKSINHSGCDKVVRPDIIFHNRKSGKDKRNILIVECKKAGASKEDIEKDVTKINTLMKDEKYAYQYGLKVSYRPQNDSGTLYYPCDTGICEEEISSKDIPYKI